jgi:hypothetical protein
MDILPILLGIGVILLIYQVVFRRDDDIDWRGHLKNLKRKKEK